jgi:hypothetical protein
MGAAADKHHSKYESHLMIIVSFSCLFLDFGSLKLQNIIKLYSLLAHKLYVALNLSVLKLKYWKQKKTNLVVLSDKCSPIVGK